MGGRRGGRQQQAFVNRIARPKPFSGGGYGALVRRLADAGEGRVVALDTQLNTGGRVIEATADEQVVGQHRAELTLNAAGRLQDVVLMTEQALHLLSAEQGRAVFQ